MTFRGRSFYYVPTACSCFPYRSSATGVRAIHCVTTWQRELLANASKDTTRCHALVTFQAQLSMPRLSRFLKISEEDVFVAPDDGG